MEKVSYSIEVAHTYAGPMAKATMLQKEQLRSISVARRLVKALEAEGLSHSICVLVDDYHEGKLAGNVDIDWLAKEMELAGCMPDYIVLESQLTRLADVLIERIAPKYLQKLHGRMVFSANHLSFPLGTAFPAGAHEIEGPVVRPSDGSQRDGQNRPLVRDELAEEPSSASTLLKTRLKTYSCPLLTACWYLFRLGVEGFGDVDLPMRRLSSKPLAGDRLLTILPAKYVGLESWALEILEATSTKTISKRRKDIEYYFFSDR